jgi:hypothetical protein
MKRCFPYLIGLFLVQSCCAYHTVTLKNNSGDDRLVTLRGHRYYYYLPKDYFWLTDLSSRRHKSKTGQKLQSVTIDSAECTYSFILPRNTKLIVQHGIGFPDFEQQVIVDNSDTIRLRNDPRAKLKYRRIDYFFAVTVDIHEHRLDAGPAATAVNSSN